MFRVTEKAQKALAAARRPKNPSTTIKLKNNGPTYTIATRRSQSPSALRVKQRVADIMAQTAEEEEAEADRSTFNLIIIILRWTVLLTDCGANRSSSWITDEAASTDWYVSFPRTGQKLSLSPVS